MDELLLKIQEVVRCDTLPPGVEYDEVVNQVWLDYQDSCVSNILTLEEIVTKTIRKLKAGDPVFRKFGRSYRKFDRISN